MGRHTGEQGSQGAFSPGPSDSVLRPGTSIRDALGWATSALLAGETETPRLDAEILLGHILSLSRTQLCVYWHDSLDAESARRYAQVVRRRAGHEPVAYLVGERAFYDVDLYVDRRVLIPRPETEQIVDEALAWSRGQHGGALRIADVGTGSGALAIVMARYLSRARVWAADISANALRVAAENISRHDLTDRICLVCCDLLGPLLGPFDLIMANLPYVARGEVEFLSPDIREYEPILALDGGEDGLSGIRRLLPQVWDRLAQPGLLLVEIGDQQAKAVVEMAKVYLPSDHVTVLRDYAGLDRVLRVER